MYFWKCWRDTRSTFFILTGLLISLAALTAIFNACTWDPGVGFVRPNPSALTTIYIASIWNGTIANMAMISSLALPMTGALLGAYGVGVDFHSGTAIFLATRPRPRWYYLLISWAVGLGEMAIGAALAMATALLLLIYFTRSVPNWKFLAMWPFMIVAGTVLFSLTGYIGVSSRLGREASGVTIVLFVAYMIAGVVLQTRLRVTMPQIFDMFNPFISGGRPSGAVLAMRLDWTSAILWSLFLPICAGLSWLSFEKAEI
jgi:hypothetical protein